MPRISCSSDGSAAITGLRLGEFARLLNVHPRRVEKWVRLGWIPTTGGGQGPGRPMTFDPFELEVARKVLRHTSMYGYQPNGLTFKAMRIRARSEARP